MSEQTPTTHRTSKRDQIRVRLQHFNSSRGQRVLGPAEIVGLAGSVLMLVLVIVSYLYFLVPARFRLSALESERSLLQAKLRDSQGAFSQGQTTHSRVVAITQSLDDFEGKTLVGANSGRMGLYDRLNTLIRKNGLRNTSGPTYTTLAPASTKAGSTGARSASTKWQTIYPGIAISVTVDGQYPNLRRFIQDIEASKQFVIINSVELERGTETNTSLSAEGQPATGSNNALVSLRLEMATYFQRASAEEASTGAEVH